LFSIGSVRPENVTVEVDEAQFSAYDNFGLRYPEYNGGDVKYFSLKSGEKQSFDMAFSLEFEGKSRIPQGTQFVLIKIQHIANMKDIQWVVPIIH
jgi:hypothetical protein